MKIIETETDLLDQKNVFCTRKPFAIAMNIFIEDFKEETALCLKNIFREYSLIVINKENKNLLISAMGKKDSEFNSVPIGDVETFNKTNPSCSAITLTDDIPEYVLVFSQTTDPYIYNLIDDKSTNYFKLLLVLGVSILIICTYFII